jgi:undecaprenyl-diphosphatase
MAADMLFLLKGFFLGLVEGLTEFIPVSSTAHLILVGDWIDFSSSSGKVFEVVIQFGSILAVMWIFRARLQRLIYGVFSRQRTELLFMRNLIIAFLPAAVIGAVMINYIKALFNHPGVFVATLMVGGAIMLWVERKPHFAKNVPDSEDSAASERASARTLEQITWKQA